jgi:putative transcriptional regulator
MTQEEFSRMLGVPLSTLRNWEHGTRQPVGAAKALLRVAAKHPNLVRRTLAAA